MSPDKKKIEKIYSQIDKLATKGKEYIYEYHKLIDDLIIKGDYNYFEQTLYYKYNIEVADYSSVIDIKNKSWAPILFQTNVPMSKRIKKLFDKKGVYQMVFDIYSESSNLNISIGPPLSPTYSTTTATQSISLSKINNAVYLTSNDSSIYSIDIYYSQWEGNKPMLNTIQLLQNISIKDRYEWSFLGATTSSLPLVTFYSPVRPYLSSNDNIKVSTNVSEYNGISDIRRITNDSNYWYVTIGKKFTSFSSSGSLNSYPISSDSIYTEIPTTQGGSYLIRTHMKNQNNNLYYELNYKVSIDKNSLLGQIVEIDKLSPDSKYYLQNKQFAKIIGTKITYLEVTKQGATSSIIVDNSTPNASEDANLLNRYKIAIDYLLS